MKKQWWVLLLTGLLVLSALFIGCEETDDDDDDSTGPSSELDGLIGTWVMASANVDGVPEYYSSVNEFEENGDGVSYSIVYGDEDEYEEWNFTWDDVDGDLEVDPDGSEEPFIVEVDFVNDNKVNMDYEYEGTRSEVYYRVTSDLDDDLYGLWSLVSATEDGTPIPDASGMINFTNDGDFFLNLTYNGEASVDTMTWSIASSALVILGDSDGVVSGQVITYSISGTTLTAQVHDGEGLQVNVFEKYEAGDIDPDLVGQWMTYTMMSGGEYSDFRETVVFNDDGTGVSYHTDTDTEDYDTEITQFLWEVVDGDLIVDTEQDDPITIDYTIQDDLLTLDFVMETNPVTEVLVKWTDELDTELAGEWIMTSMTVNGMPEEIGYNLTVINDDGTGVYTFDEGEDEYTWCVNGDKMLISSDEMVGYVGDYTVTEEEFVFTEYHADGEIVSTYEPFTPGEDLDPDLFGTWIGSTRYVDGSIIDGYSMIVLYPNGTGIFAFELEYPGDWQEYYHNVTWTTDEGTLILYEGQTILHSVDYVVSGDHAATGYTDENNQVFEQTFYRMTGDNPSDLVGTWLMQSETLDGGPDVMMSMAATVELEAEGSATIYVMEYDEELEEDIIVEYYGEWCVADGYFLMRFMDEVEEYMVAEAIEYEMPQSNVLELTDPRDEGEYIFTYRKFVGTVDPDMVGTWVGYLMTMQTGMGNWSDSEQTQTIVANADGTGTTYSAYEMGEDENPGDYYEYDEVDFVWLVSDGLLLVIDDDGYGSVMPYTLDGDFMEMTMTESEMDMRYTIVMNWVRATGESDVALLGEWVLTDVYEDGTSVGVEENITITFNNDGTGLYVEAEETGNFSWTTSNGYLVIHIDDNESPDNLFEGIEYSVEAGEFRVVEYKVDYSGMPRTIEVVEVFTQPTR